MVLTATGKASILAIGTELTTGQITNRNAAWLAERLADLGVETVLHETVADDREMIQAALDHCRSVSSLILVTGGLGPTTDDFTRESIAEWAKKPLRFYEPSWLKIHGRLTRLGIPVAESNRQQAYYPESAEVIVNDQGTADAFTLKLSAKNRGADATDRIWVLPGPPHEVECVWKNGIEAQVRACVPHLKPLQLLTWQCIGKSEAELGELTERALAGSGLKTGYRAHRPYVEIKVWCTDQESRTHSEYFEKLEAAIGPWVATRQGEDLAESLLGLLARADEVEITDACSGGILAERLGQALRLPACAPQAESVILTTEWCSPSNPESWIRQVLSESDALSLTLAIAGLTPAGEWALGLRDGATTHVETLQSPYLGPELLDRSRRFVVESALKRWGEWLKVSIQ